MYNYFYYHVMVVPQVGCGKGDGAMLEWNTVK